MLLQFFVLVSRHKATPSSCCTSNGTVSFVQGVSDEADKKPEESKELEEPKFLAEPEKPGKPEDPKPTTLTLEEVGNDPRL